MATVRLARKGNLLIFKTPKLVVTVPAPQVSPIYDQCAVLTGYKVGASYSISGRIDCFQKMTEVARVSVRYFYGLGFATGDGNLSDDLEVLNLFVPNPPAFIRDREHFLNNPALPLERSADGSVFPLLDVCDVPIGTVDNKNVSKYAYTPDCTAIAKYGFSSTVARHSSVTADNITDHVTTLMQTFFLTEQANVGLAAIQNAMLLSWSQLTNDTIVIPVGAFEPIVTP